MSSIDSFGTSGLANAIQASSKTNETSQATNKYGNTVGKPELSDTAAEYYESLKKKYSNLDFVLVANDSVNTAEQQAAKFMKGKTLVLLDAEKIEKMATDENYRKKYEAIIENGIKQLDQMEDALAKSGAKVKGFGIRVNDDGTTTLFAALEKSSEAQSKRIEKAQETKKEARKEASKKASEKAAEKATEKAAEKSAVKAEKSDSDVSMYDIINASSIEDLLDKISAYQQNNLLNSAKTQAELQVGQSIDFKL